VTLTDVMSVLQIMKADQSKTDIRLSELSSKMNEMYDYENYYEDELLRDDGEGEPEPNNIDNQPDINDCDDNLVTDDNNNEPPAKRQKTTEDSTSTDTGNEQNSLFKGIRLISEKFKVKEKVDTAVDAELAENVNGLASAVSQWFTRYQID